MLMLHELFSKYDALCVRHNVFKVETIGGACGVVLRGRRRRRRRARRTRVGRAAGHSSTPLPFLSAAPGKCTASGRASPAPADNWSRARRLPSPRADCYMACTGLLHATPMHAHQLVEFALDLLAAAASVRNPLTGAPLR